MRYAWVLNLDAELELARGRPGYVAQRKLTQQLAEHGTSSRALLGPNDFELSSGVPELTGTTVRGRAWCPTPLALEAMRRHGIEPEPYPEASVLRRVNHRRFAHELGGGLPRQCYVSSRSELARGTRASADRQRLLGARALPGRRPAPVRGTGGRRS